MSKLKLDLHDIYNKSHLIDKALNDIIQEAVDKKIKEIEIIPGKGSGQLKKKVLRFLNQPEIKKRYHRINKDSKNFGRIFVPSNLNFYANAYSPHNYQLPQKTTFYKLYNFFN